MPLRENKSPKTHEKRVETKQKARHRITEYRFQKYVTQILFINFQFL